MTDEESIRRALAEFCRCLDERRFEEWSELFTDDAEFQTRHRFYKGRPAILNGIKRGALANNPDLHRKHTNPNVVIYVDGDVADVACDLIQYDQVEGSWKKVTIAKYVDRMVRKGDRWLFLRREIVDAGPRYN